jgi:DNA processing protein
MAEQGGTAALVALLRGGRRPWREYAAHLEEPGGIQALLGEELGLLADEQVQLAVCDLERWTEQGIRACSVLDPDYPANLRAVHDRPPLIFIAGRLQESDSRAVAIIGSRQASPSGVGRARAIAKQLVADGYTVASGLAAGIDSAAHHAALDSGGRTIAVIGTGLLKSYPPQNAALQRRIATECAVISQFWPEAPPTRKSFPLRNAVMSGMSLATVVVEASPTSGARTQARLALAHGRPVLLVDSLLSQDWAKQLATRPGTHVVGSPAEVTEVVERITAPGTLVG